MARVAREAREARKAREARDTVYYLNVQPTIKKLNRKTVMILSSHKSWLTIFLRRIDFIAGLLIHSTR